MRLHVIGSGSKGNCYLLKAGNGETLMLEAGVAFRKVLPALGGSTRNVAACLVTHEHGDHAKHARDVAGHGIRLAMTQGTAEALGLGDSSTVTRFHSGHVLQFGGFAVLPFDTRHDAKEPCGFLIDHAEMGTLLFATDTGALPELIPGLSHVMIEANYDPERLADREDIPLSTKVRIAASHMSIDDAVEALTRRIDLKGVRCIVLIHLSEHDGDPDGFLDRVAGATGKEVHTAAPGLTVDLSPTPF